MSEIDSIKVKELELHIMNNQFLYNQYISFAKNYARKKDREDFNNELAIKGLKNNLVANAIRSYSKEYGEYLGMKFSNEEKEYLSKQLLEQLERDEIPRYRKQSSNTGSVYGRGNVNVRSHKRKNGSTVRSHSRNVKRKFK